MFAGLELQGLDELRRFLFLLPLGPVEPVSRLVAHHLGDFTAHVELARAFGIVIGAIFAFVHSAHELLVATFVLGGVGKPVAVKIWSGVQATSDPTIAAASAILIGLAVFTFASAAATQWLAKRRTV